MALILQPWGILVLLISLAVAAKKTNYNLQCVVCDSYTSGEICSTWDQFSFITNCSDVPRVDKTRPMSCRKIYQTVNHVSTVIRQCSNIVDHDGCIDRVGSKDVRTRHCHCTTDLCNLAHHHRRSTLWIQIGLSSLLSTGLLHLIRG
ncbi:unnamed protein product [Calicophoron daubneyi]|uniref:Protein sleepless n=1 Tax=Calicophoron daubneyi TaxID=300641 RepID=A0AAV2TGF5_CALDB